MILYELPNGKSVFISVEQLLSLTHQGIQDLVASNTGFASNDPFQSLPKSSKDFKQYIEDDEFEDDEPSPDILSDGDDDPYINIDINNIPDN